jgi:hypothetical protein
MNKSNVVELKAPAKDALGELLKEGARQLLSQAIEAEVAELLAQYAGQTVDGKRAVVRNGYLPERTLQTGLGDVPIKVPKVRDRSGQSVKFNSKLGRVLPRKMPHECYSVSVINFSLNRN